MKYDFSDDKIFVKGLGDMIYFRADAPPQGRRYKSCFLLLFSVVVVVVTCCLVAWLLVVVSGTCTIGPPSRRHPGGWLCVIHLERVDDLLLRQGDPNHWGDFGGETVLKLNMCSL